MALVTLPAIGADPVSITSSVLNGKVDPLATDYNGNIQNVNIASGAGIVYSKLSLTDGILNADINSAAAIVASKLDLSPVAQTIEMSSKAILEAKGADIASATTTTIWATDGNFMHITGTTTITGFGTATQIGEMRTIVFDGILTLTHNATSLILPTAANITTAAGDTAIVRAETTANARVIAYLRKDGTALTGYTASTALSGSVIQTQYTELTTPVNITAVYTADDTAPLYSEGNAIGNVTITPNNASNLIRIRATFWGAYSTSQKFAFWINDATGSDEALAVRSDEATNAAAGDGSFVIETTVTAGSTNARTYYLVAGVASGTVYVGRADGGADMFGAASFGSITVEEIKA